MTFPATTALYASVLALIYVAMSGWVIAGRFKFGVLQGDGDKDGMRRRMRSHANFAEYVPLILLLAGLLEAGGASPGSIHWLLLPLTIARIAHPVGMLAPENSLRQYVCRGGGAVLTLTVLIAAAVRLLVRWA